MKTIRQSLAGIAIAALIVGCGGDNGGTGPDVNPPANPVPTTLTPAVASQTLHIGENATLVATVRDQFGQAMSATVTWASDDPTVASVTADGVVTALDAGIADVVASASGLTAVVEVGVRFVVAEDEIKLRVRGAIDETWTWANSFSVHFDYLGTSDESCRMVLLEKPFNFFGTDGWYVGLLIPWAPSVGVVDFENWNISTELLTSLDDLTGPIAYVGVDMPSGETRLFADRGTSWVELDQLTSPQGSGVFGGRMTGRLAFEGEEYVVTYSEGEVASATPTGARITVHGDFSMPYAHVPLATSTSEFVGGPFAGTFEQWDIDVEYEGDVFSRVGYSLDYGGERGDYFTWQDVHIPDISEGTYEMTLGTWSDWTDPMPWVSGSFYFDPTSTWLMDVGSTGGSLTIERFVPGTAEGHWGEVKGRISAVLEENPSLGWFQTPETMMWNLDFHAPVYTTEPGVAVSADAWRPGRSSAPLRRISPRAAR